MQPNPPFWFRNRQGKLEAVEPDSYRLTAPNLVEAFISIRSTPDGRWEPMLRLSKDGPNVAEAPALATPQEAWDAAFELYRVQLVV